jgi:DNA-binding transcriptional ArsR family regulator
MGKPDDQMLNRGARTYLAHAVKAATHPVRREILKSLKKGPQSTVDLEGELKESRYNLYHHLDVLSSAGLVKESSSKSGGKIRHFALKEPKRPELAVLLFDEAELKHDPKGREHLLDALEELEGKPIPHRDKVVSAEIQLRYPWSK